MEMVTSIGLSMLVIGCLLVAVIFGFITAAVCPPDRLDRHVAFAWGWALGPIGLVVMLVLRARNARRLPPIQPEGF